MSVCETYYKSIRVGDSEAHLGALLVTAILRPFTPGEDAVVAWILTQDATNLLDLVHLQDGRDLCVFERLYQRETYEQAIATSDAYIQGLLSRIPRQHDTPTK
jgi:hypothetical protein